MPGFVEMEEQNLLKSNCDFSWEPVALHRRATCDWIYPTTPGSCSSQFFDDLQDELDGAPLPFLSHLDTEHSENDASSTEGRLLRRLELLQSTLESADSTPVRHTCSRRPSDTTTDTMSTTSPLMVSAAPWSQPVPSRGVPELWRPWQSERV